MDKIGFSFLIDKAELKHFKLLCIQNDTTPTAQIRKFIRDYVDNTQVKE